MTLSANQQKMLRTLPGVDHVLELFKTQPLDERIPKTVVVNSIRNILESHRKSILAGDHNIREESLSDTCIIELVTAAINQAMTPNLKTLVNATGIVVHTNLGRSLLPDEVIENLSSIAGRYSNLEYELNAGKRGSRHNNIEDILCEISGA
ncbi:MAG: L-seryl-tRNA(Sec) selenium transferase, partial [Desulfobacterales bacterium]|nr:L-seryl-tRNA(Sec) selenium transferase [Desulfobacterales bacterium]